MKLTNKQYDILKWVISIVLPALIVFLNIVFNELGWVHTETFVSIAVALEVFLGSIFKLSDHKYKKEQQELQNSEVE